MIDELTLQQYLRMHRVIPNPNALISEVGAYKEKLVFDKLLLDKKRKTMSG